MTFAVFLDLIVVLLLLTAIGVALVLNSRLAAFRAARSEFEQIIERFNTAAARAEAGVSALRMSGAETGHALQQNIATARALRDELAFLVERAEPIADRTGRPGAAARPVAQKPAPARSSASPSTAKPAPTEKSGAIPADPSELFKLLSALR